MYFYIVYRFGKCEVYEHPVDVCALRLGVDYVYVSNRLGGTQNSISTVLNEIIESVDLIATHDKDCVDQVYRLICHYYLPTCGNFTHFIPPSSLCQEECNYVKDNCEATWRAADITFTDLPFIDCDDTAQLLSPLPNCCTGAGIETTPTSNDSDSIGSGAVAGIVIVILFILAIPVGFLVAFLIIKYVKKNKMKQMEMMQLDIMGR